LIDRDLAAILSFTALGANPGLRAAYFSYNHSDAYVDRVLSFARGYEAQLGPLTPSD